MWIEFLMLGEGKELGRQLYPAINSFARRRNVGAHFLGLLRAAFGKPQTRFDYGKKIPEIVGDSAGHFPERRKPLARTGALLRGGAVFCVDVKRPGKTPFIARMRRFIATDMGRVLRHDCGSCGRTICRMPSG
jgi:hypothetical protein